jgi:hypothetical protein
MKQICYISYLSDGFNVNETIESIKKVSQVKNKKYGLTGRLLYSQEIFIQFLEGADINVDITYTIIQNDERNHGNQFLFTQESEERFYPDWDMNFKYVEKIDLVSINKVLQLAQRARTQNHFKKSEVEKIFEDFE